MDESFTYTVAPNVKGRCSLVGGITVATIILEKLQQKGESWGKSLRLLDSLALPFQGILCTVPTWRFLGFIVIRNVACPHKNANQVLWLLGNFSLLSSPWATPIYRTIKACGIAESRGKESSA